MGEKHHNIILEIWRYDERMTILYCIFLFTSFFPIFCSEWKAGDLSIHWTAPCCFNVIILDHHFPAMLLLKSAEVHGHWITGNRAYHQQYIFVSITFISWNICHSHLGVVRKKRNKNRKFVCRFIVVEIFYSGSLVHEMVLHRML